MPRERRAPSVSTSRRGPGVRWRTRAVARGARGGGFRMRCLGACGAAAATRCRCGD